MTDPASGRLPVLFLGHGSPMNAIEDNPWRRNWRALGAEFGTRWPRPSLILAVSSHWLTEGAWLTAMEQPRTIHDFGGFPQALFDEQYPAPGAPARAAAIAREIGEPTIGLDRRWGLDHGTWSVIKPMFPAADIPVIQLSMDYSRPPAEHFALGARLRKLRDEGVLIVGSGNSVHNLRAAKWGVPDTEAYDWAVAFDDHVRARIEAGELEKLADFQSLDNIAKLAHPTHEHYLPLLYAAGAADPGEPARFFNEGYQLGSIAMRSVVWG